MKIEPDDIDSELDHSEAQETETYLTRQEKW